MNKFIIIALALILTFSCNRKVTTFQPKITYELPSDTLDVGDIFEPIDTSKVLYGYGVTIDTGDDNLIKYTDGTALRLSVWEPTLDTSDVILDTSDVIIKYVFSWEEGEIETLACKVVYPTSIFGIWLGVTGEGSKLFKVKDGVWIPIEWPKDPVELYIKPKK